MCSGGHSAFRGDATCVSTLEAIKGLHRGGPAVAVGPDKATDDGREQHRPVAEVEKELAMVSRRLFLWYTAKNPTRRPGDPFCVYMNVALLLLSDTSFLPVLRHTRSGEEACSR